MPATYIHTCLNTLFTQQRRCIDGHIHNSIHNVNARHKDECTNNWLANLLVIDSAPNYTHYLILSKVFSKNKQEKG